MTTTHHTTSRTDERRLPERSESMMSQGRAPWEYGD